MLFQYCKDCVVQSISIPAVISACAHVFTAAVAICAYLVAKHNLEGLRNNQTIQAEMHLFGIEQSLSSSMARQRRVSREKGELTKRTIPDDSGERVALQQELEKLTEEENDLIKEISRSANKLAHLTNSTAVNYFFPKKEWKQDYSELFRDVVDITDDRQEMNVHKVKSKLEEWAGSPRH